MIFDFEPQHNQPHFETIRRMLVYYDDSTFQGKLYINYPMMQSYKHYAALPDPLFYNTIATSLQWYDYKEIVGKVSGYTDITKYTYPIIKELIEHHLKKAKYILTNSFILPTIDEYLSWSFAEIFDKQVVYKEQKSFVYVLNTCIFVIIDYRPLSFFRQLK